jgi:hypothetical protein
MAVWELEAFLILRASFSNYISTHEECLRELLCELASKSIFPCPLSTPNGKYFGSTTYPPVHLMSQGLIHVVLAFAFVTFIHLNVRRHSSPWIDEGA